MPREPRYADKDRLNEAKRARLTGQGANLEVELEQLQDSLAQHAEIIEVAAASLREECERRIAEIDAGANDTRAKIERIEARLTSIDEELAKLPAPDLPAPVEDGDGG
jgi:chromosome segregation ATPase